MRRHKYTHTHTHQKNDVDDTKDILPASHIIIFQMKHCKRNCNKIQMLPFNITKFEMHAVCVAVAIERRHTELDFYTF